MSKQLRICNKYDMMMPQEIREVLASFRGLSDEAVAALVQVTDVLVQKYVPQADCRIKNAAVDNIKNIVVNKGALYS